MLFSSVPAQDALTALVAGSPTGMMMGPLSLGGPLTLTGAYPPPSTGPVNVTSTNGQAGFDDLLKWLQTGLTPRSTRGGPTPRGGSSTANGGGSSGQGPSPRPLTRSLTKSLTPRGGAIANGTAPAQQAGMANSRLTTPRGGSASGAGPSSQSQSQSQQGDGQLHDGHRQLLCKLLSTAKASMEVGPWGGSGLELCVGEHAAMQGRLAKGLRARLQDIAVPEVCMLGGCEPLAAFLESLHASPMPA